MTTAVSPYHRYSSGSEATYPGGAEIAVERNDWSQLAVQRRASPARANAIESSRKFAEMLRLTEELLLWSRGRTLRPILILPVRPCGGAL